MSTQAETIQRMRDAGRSWTEISDRTGLRVPEAKAAVETLARARRGLLANSKVSLAARGLDVACRCGHTRLEHAGADRDGECVRCGPDRDVLIQEWWGADGVHASHQVPDRRVPMPENATHHWISPMRVGCDAFADLKPDQQGWSAWAANRILGGPGAKPGKTPAFRPDYTPSRKISRGPDMPQVARKRRRSPGSRGKDHFVPRGG